ncbi:MucR family transcriptional regulator [Desulfuromonas sp. TF]|uniref:MucR family transcriptional regulator n=1 Tax=Desulfuromonas sp. TF TaxID=1232410 RepID=UPI0004864319|nr:MucR family transcriptional regulator [Desulfuromonas sp. TF]
MPTLLELATNIVSAHASTSAMTREELLAELQEVHNALSKMEKGEAVTEAPAAAEEQPAVSMKKAFGKKEIVCLVCGRGGMKTLGRHLRSAHDMTPKEYKKQFNIPASQKLAAKDYSESRRQMAIDRDLGAGLAKARAARGKKK